MARIKKEYLEICRQFRRDTEADGCDSAFAALATEMLKAHYQFLGEFEDKLQKQKPGSKHAEETAGRIKRFKKEIDKYHKMRGKKIIKMRARRA